MRTRSRLCGPRQKKSRRNSFLLKRGRSFETKSWGREDRLHRTRPEVSVRVHIPQLQETHTYTGDRFLGVSSVAENHRSWGDPRC